MITTNHQLCLGIDENGLGPRLGPLVVTAVAGRATRAGVGIAESAPGNQLIERLGDSKALVSYKDSSLGEAWARAVMLRIGTVVHTPDDLLHALSIESRPDLRSRCPDRHVSQCWGTDGERFAAPDVIVEQLARDLDDLAEAGVLVANVDVALVCSERLNRALDEGRSRLHVDLHTMERLVLCAHERFRTEHGGTMRVTCGKVGGFDRYLPHLSALSDHNPTLIVEGRARSEYHLPGIGNVAFVRDADAHHLLVCMASLIGKWVRDRMMGRIVSYHRAYDPTLPTVSGYHDPATQRFVTQSATARTVRKLPLTCFERRSLSGKPTSP